MNTLRFSRGTCHDRHLDALRVVNYGVEGMGLPNKENRTQSAQWLLRYEPLKSVSDWVGPGRTGPLILRFYRYIEKTSLVITDRADEIIWKRGYLRASTKFYFII